MLRDAVVVVPYEPAQSLKHNDTRGKTVRPCHVSIPYPSMTVGGDAHGAPPCERRGLISHRSLFVFVGGVARKAF